MISPALPSSPRVVVILPTHNRPMLLAEAIQSLSDQSLHDWEAIIVDDASVVPVTLSPDPRLRLIRHAGAQGGAAAKNSGAREATAPVLAFLDDDDLYDPRYLEQACRVLDTHPELDVVFMGVSWFGEAAQWGEQAYRKAMAKVMDKSQPQVLQDQVWGLGQDALFKALLERVPMAFQRPVVRREFFERIGGYSPQCLLWDCDWALRAALVGHCALIEAGLYRQRADGQGYSSTRNRRLEQLLSNVEMKSRLLSNPAARAKSRDVRGAVSNAWMDIAWENFQQCDKKQAWLAWRNGFAIHPKLNHLRMLRRLLFAG